MPRPTEPRRRRWRRPAALALGRRQDRLVARRGDDASALTDMPPCVASAARPVWCPGTRPSPGTDYLGGLSRRGARAGDAAVACVFRARLRRPSRPPAAGTPVLIDLPPHLPRVMADRRRIVQVLNNLLSNAARHSPQSAPYGSRPSTDGAHVAVSVQDEGRGVGARAAAAPVRQVRARRRRRPGDRRHGPRAHHLQGAGRGARRLPGADGIALMGSVPELPALPVIFISGYGRDETIAGARPSKGTERPLSDPRRAAERGRRPARRTPTPFLSAS